eukprot:gene1423-1650_t
MGDAHCPLKRIEKLEYHATLLLFYGRIILPDALLQSNILPGLKKLVLSRSCDAKTIIDKIPLLTSLTIGNMMDMTPFDFSLLIGRVSLTKLQVKYWVKGSADLSPLFNYLSAQTTLTKLTANIYDQTHISRQLEAILINKPLITKLGISRFVQLPNTITSLSISDTNNDFANQIPLLPESIRTLYLPRLLTAIDLSTVSSFNSINTLRLNTTSHLGMDTYRWNIQETETRINQILSTPSLSSITTFIVDSLDVMTLSPVMDDLLDLISITNKMTSYNKLKTKSTYKRKSIETSKLINET